MFPMQRYVVYHEDEWGGGDVIDQVIMASSYSEAKSMTTRLMWPEYLSPYKLKQQD